MKFSCTKENLARGLATISRASTKQAHLPILENVLVSCTNGTIELASTNLEISVKTQVRGKIEQEGDYTVPAKLFTDFVQLLPDGTVDVDLHDDALFISSDSSKTKIKGEPSQDFPIIPKIEADSSCSISVSAFRDVLGSTTFAASLNQARPVLTGVYFSLHDPAVGKGKAIVAAMDGYRLSETTLSIEGGDEGTVIIPRQTLSELQRILAIYKDDPEAPPAITLHYGAEQLAFSYGDFELVTRHISGAYPDYRQIIPKDSKTIVRIVKADLSDAIKRASLFSRNGLFDIKLTFDAENQKLEVKAKSGARGENSVSIDAQIQGEPNEVTLNYRYLLDGVQVASQEHVIFAMNDAKSPCVLRVDEELNEPFLYVVMPIRG